MTVSVIVPVYNQYAALMKTLLVFSIQRYEKEEFEVIVVDDGSTDETSLLTDGWLTKTYAINIHIIHGTNQGRSYARNCGAEAANSDYIIFSDCDRFPALNFIEKHLEWKDKTDIVIGQSLDYFGKNEYILEPLNWEMIKKYSRISNYQKRITQIYDENHRTNSALAWMSFLVGNSSMKKEIWSRIGGFDNTIKKWGFEHFDFAYRAWQKKTEFAYDNEIKNYHIPHSREKGFYKEAIEDNINMFREKHPEINSDMIRNILLKSVDVVEYENVIF